MKCNGLNLLLIADVGAESQHSSVEGLFKSRRNLGVTCTKVFFDKSIQKTQVINDRIVLPYKYRRHGLVAKLRAICLLSQFDAIVVRNIYSVLDQILRGNVSAKVGFWESFPHNRRRLDEAILENKAVWRKRIEYAWFHHNERRLLKRCDFYLPITETHKFIYFPDIQTPYHPTPMGFDFDAYLPRQIPERKGPVRFVYIGAIDNFRRLDIVNRAFICEFQEYAIAETVEDILSKNRKELVKMGQQLQQRIRQERDYDEMAQQLFEFIDRQCRASAPAPNIYPQPAHSTV